MEKKKITLNRAYSRANFKQWHESIQQLYLNKLDPIIKKRLSEMSKAVNK